MFYSDSDLIGFLPSKQKAHLKEALGCTLTEVERYFFMDISAFLRHSRGRFSQDDFFLYNSGVTQMVFENGVVHPLDVYGEQLSVIIHPEPFPSDISATRYLLSKQVDIPGSYRNCLGQICEDVRICIYLHEDLDSDYLLLGDKVPRDKVKSCFSIGLDCEILV